MQETLNKVNQWGQNGAFRPKHMSCRIIKWYTWKEARLKWPVHWIQTGSDGMFGSVGRTWDAETQQTLRLLAGRPVIVAWGFSSGRGGRDVDRKAAVCSAELLVQIPGCQLTSCVWPLTFGWHGGEPRAIYVCCEGGGKAQEMKMKSLKSDNPDLSICLN